MKIFKGLLITLLALSMVSCGTKVTEEKTKLSILSPKGAPALSIISEINGGNTVKTVDGTDLLQAAFVNPTPEYDVIIAPTNLGIKLAEANKTTYRCLGVITWGNLYLVADDKDALSKPGEIAAFGEGAVPGLLFANVMGNVTQNVTYYPSVAEAQAALLSGKASIALLAEPAATATIIKGKEMNKSFSIIVDLQEAMQQPQSTMKGYPQAAIFVEESKYKANPKAFDTMIENMNSYIASAEKGEGSLVADVNKIGADVLGIPSGELASKVWKNCNIHYKDASESMTDLENFLSIFSIKVTENSMIKK